MEQGESPTNIGVVSVDEPIDSNAHPRLVLGTTVFAATGIAGLVNAIFPVVPRLLGIDMVTGIFLTNSVSPFLHALLPLAFVYVVCKRIAGFPISTRAIVIISLAAAILGRYVGTSVGYVLLGRQLPTPLVLVSSADLAAREFSIGMWVGVVLGILGAGLWGAVGTYGGIGLFSHSSNSE